MPNDRPNILVVDDWKKDQEMLAAPFRGHYDVRFAANLEEAGQVLETWWPDIALVDAMFPPRRGAPPGFQVGPFLDLVDKGTPAYLRTPQIIIVSNQNEAAKRFDQVRIWLNEGRVADVIAKGTADMGVEFFNAVVRLRVEMLLDRQRWRSVQRNAESATEWFRRLGIITVSPRVLALRASLEAAVRSTGCVLLSGPTGSGKLMFARAFHKLAHAEKKFQNHDCSTIAPLMFEAEMFGVEGTPGKVVNPPFIDREGILEAAGDGTLFLDEIQTLSLEQQAKFRKALDERRFRRVGGTTEKWFRARLLAATNQDLKSWVASGRFLPDLYYRICAFRIEIPALADRLEDLPGLAEDFLEHYVAEQKRLSRPCPSIRLNPRSLALLSSYSWPGNVRELRTAIETVAAYAAGADSEEVEITPELLAERAPELTRVTAAPAATPQDPLLASAGIGVQHWSDLTEQKTRDAIEGLPPETAKPEFDAMLAALQPRRPGAGPDVPGRDNQDPTTINCLKGLLYVLLHPDNRVTPQDLNALLHLGAWDSGKKIMKVLACAVELRPAFKPFLMLPAARARQIGMLAPELRRHPA